MLRRITLVAATIAALSLSAHAFAVTAQAGAYVGVVGGWSFAHDTSNANMQASTKSNQNYVWGANLGYDYMLNPSYLVGAEFGYVNFGKTNYSGAGSNNIGASETNWGYQILATGTYFMNNGWNAVAKLGAIDETTNINPNGGISGTSIDATDVTKWEPAAAIGVGYMPMQNLNVALQWEHTFGQSWNTTGAATKPMTQDALTLGVTYKFAM